MREELHECRKGCAHGVRADWFSLLPRGPLGPVNASVKCAAAPQQPAEALTAPLPLTAAACGGSTGCLRYQDRLCITAFLPCLLPPPPLRYPLSDPTGGRSVGWGGRQEPIYGVVFSPSPYFLDRSLANVLRSSK